MRQSSGKIRGQKVHCEMLFLADVTSKLGDAAYIRQSIEASIKRLGTTPYLYYQHRVDPDVYSAIAHGMIGSAS